MSGGVRQTEGKRQTQQTPAPPVEEKPKPEQDPEAVLPPPAPADAAQAARYIRDEAVCKFVPLAAVDAPNQSGRVNNTQVLTQREAQALFHELSQLAFVDSD